MLTGTIGPSYGTYNVSAVPPLPFQRTRNNFSTYNNWTKPDEILYYTPLDPKVSYIITIWGDPDPSKELGLHGCEYCDYAA